MGGVGKEAVKVQQRALGTITVAIRPVNLFF